MVYFIIYRCLLYLVYFLNVACCLEL